MLRRLKTYTKKLETLDIKDKDLVGNEALYYSLISQAVPNLPNAFIITSLAFDDFLMANNLVEPILFALEGVKPYAKDTAQEAAGTIANYILSSQFPTVIAAEIVKEYAHLVKISNNSYVKLSFSSVLDDTYISSFDLDYVIEDISNAENLLKSIKLLWLKLFSTESIEIRANTFYKGPITIAITVFSEVKSEVTSTSYSIPPITKEDDTIEIHSLYGIDNPKEYISSDSYKVDIKTGKITEKIIVGQQNMFIKKGGANEDESIVKVEISKAWKNQQKVADNRILEIAAQHLRISNQLKSPLEAKWGIEGGKLYLISFKLITPIEKDKKDEDLQNEFNKEILHKEERTEPKPNLNELQKEIEQVISGKEDIINKNIISIKKKELKMVNSRKKKKLNTSLEIKNLSDKNKIKTKLFIDVTEINSSNVSSISYFDGAFYDGTELVLNHDVLPEDIYSNKEKSNNLIESYSLDISLVSQNTDNKKLIYQFSNITENELKLLNVKDIKTSYYGDERFIDKPESLIIEATAIKKAKRIYGSDNLSLCLPSIRTLKNLEDIKKILVSQSIRRNDSQKLYVDVSIPSFIYELKDLKDDFIDGLIVNYDSLLMLLVYRESIREADHYVILPLLEQIAKECKKHLLEFYIRVTELPNEVLSEIIRLKPTGIIFTNIPHSSLIELIKNAEAS